MPYILRRKDLEVRIDDPLEGYNFPRFDWTGKITSIKFHGVEFCGVEKLNISDKNAFGRGLYNEFGIDKALGFAETEIGDWFHKIGVGLLQKKSDQYHFHELYKIEPADFYVNSRPDKLSIVCESKKVNGYGYLLKKEISLLESSMLIEYSLINTGEKVIETEEYCHNFINIGSSSIDESYLLEFPFELDQSKFGETVNPEQKVIINGSKVNFNGNPMHQIYFSNLSGNEYSKAQWLIIHVKNRVGLSEKGSFNTDKVNLWGWGHVLSPELFCHISLLPGVTSHWSRQYRFFNL